MNEIFFITVMKGLFKVNNLVLQNLHKSVQMKSISVCFQHGAGSGESMAGNGEGFAWLEEDENTPDDFFVVGAKYRGPKIVDSDEVRFLPSSHL